MQEEKTFDKYSRKGAGFHYEELNERKLATYNTHNRAKFVRTCDLIKEALGGETNGKKLVDIGCGDGVLLWHLQQALSDLGLSGIDPEEAALAVAREKIANARLVRGTAYESGEPDGAYDLAVSTDVIEHLAEPERIFLEMKRMVKPGGGVIIGTPVRLTKTPRDYNHVQEFFPEDLLEIFQKYFSDTRLVMSHSLFWTTVYSQPAWHKFRWKYLIDLLDIYLGYNVFLREKHSKNSYFSYFYVIGRKP